MVCLVNKQIMNEKKRNKSNYRKLDGHDDPIKVSPWDEANFISKCAIYFMWPLVWAYERGQINLDNYLAASKSQRAERVCQNLSNNYYDYDKTKPKRSLWSATMKTFLPEMIWPTLLHVIGSCFWKPLQVLSLAWLIGDSSNYMKINLQINKQQALTNQIMYNNETVPINSQTASQHHDLVSQDPLFADLHNRIIFHTSVLILSTWMFPFFLRPYLLMSVRTGLKCRIATTSLIYKKALKLSQASLNVATTGQMTNLLSNDVNRFETLSEVAINLVVAPIQVIVTFLLLFQWYIGLWSTLVAFATTLLLTLCQTSMGRCFGVFRRHTTHRSDERIRIINELISGIRIIKMYAWEEPLKLLVEAARRREMNMVALSTTLSALNFAIYIVSDYLIIAFTLITYLSLGYHFDAEKIFATVALCTLMKLPVMNDYPKAVMQVAETMITCQRISEFLDLPERKTKSRFNFDRTINRTEAALFFDGVSATWTEDTHKNHADSMIFEKLSLNLRFQDLLLVVGRVGAGKSSLLMSILGESPVCSGNIQVNGKLSYCPQQAWVFPGTVRENILFERPYEPDRYESVVKVCSLSEDMQLLPYGDETLVGERGISLSGGQKARINLARCLYCEADIYLLDDPLSAVDAPVARAIFRDAIQGFLQSKCVVLVTHQLQFLKQATRLLVLDKDYPPNFGSFNQVYKSKAFSDLGFAQEDFDDATLQPQPHFDDSLSEKEKSSDTSLDPIILGKSNKITNLYDRQTQSDSSQNSSGDWPSFRYYVNSASGWFGLMCFAIMTVVCQFVMVYIIIYLGIWSKKVQDQSMEGAKFKKTTWFDQLDQHQFVFLFLGLILVAFVLSLIRILMFFYGTIRASVLIHKQFFNSLLSAPTKFFDFNPIGILLIRLGRDIGYIDQLLPRNLFDVVTTICHILSMILLAIYVNPWNAIAGVILVILSNLIRMKLSGIIVQLKLLEGVKSGPVFTHVSISMQGLTTIRAFKNEHHFINKSNQLLDDLSAVSSIYYCGSRLLSLAMDVVCLAYVTTVLLNVMQTMNQGDISLSSVGLIIAQIIKLPFPINRATQQYVEASSQMTCVQRVMDYSSIEPEESQDQRLGTISSGSSRYQRGSTPGGQIAFIGVSLRYFDDEPPVLHNLSIVIERGEKVGVVGRTGAGKSSIIATLFRLFHFEGCIEIDGQDTKSMTLQQLRSSISIIPQDPVLFAGSIRKNLDPFTNHTDEELWQALEAVQLRDHFAQSNLKLEYKIQEAGSNLSVGQRQLICLARAIIRRNDILVMDEATANVDPETDAFIQQTIRAQFANCTVITIAHRLITVADSDRILVLDQGIVQEFDEPQKLLQNKAGSFRQMVDSTRKEQAKRLKQAIKEAHRRRQLVQK